MLVGLVAQACAAVRADVAVACFGFPGGRVFEVQRGLPSRDRHGHLLVDLERRLDARPRPVELGEGGAGPLPYALTELAGMRQGWALPLAQAGQRFGILFVGRREPADEGRLALVRLEELAEQMSVRAAGLALRGGPSAAATVPASPAADRRARAVATLSRRLADRALEAGELHGARIAVGDAVASAKELLDVLWLTADEQPRIEVEGAVRSLRALATFGAHVRPFLDEVQSPASAAHDVETARRTALVEDPELGLLGQRLVRLGLLRSS